MTKRMKILIGILVAVMLGIATLTWLAWVPPGGVSPDAKAMAAMAQIQAKAELINSRDKSYNNLSCTYDDVMIKLCTDIEKRVGTKPVIHKTKDKYCAYIKLKGEGFYCMDSSGFRKSTTVDPSNIGYCNGITFVCKKE